MTEILIGKTRMEIVGGNYAGAKNYASECVTLNPNLGDCHWYLALSKIYSKDVSGGKKDIQTASSKGYDTISKTSLGELSDAYGYIQNYQDLIPIYERFITLSPDNAQYHSSLAFFYKQTGEYNKARKEALLVLKLSPESKQNVEEFLNSLPR